jgi:hypothetical protein
MGMTNVLHLIYLPAREYRFTQYYAIMTVAKNDL